MSTNSAQLSEGELPPLLHLDFTLYAFFQRKRSPGTSRGRCLAKLSRPGDRQLNRVD